MVARAQNRTVPGFPIAAIPRGHVVLSTDPATLMATRGHERAHVAQYARWRFLLPWLYLASSLGALIQGRSAYRDNYIERRAAFEEFSSRQAA